jgi:hypothetical protein
MSEHKNADSAAAPYHQPRSVEEMTKQNVQTIVQLEETAKATRDKTQSCPIRCHRLSELFIHRK